MSEAARASRFSIITFIMPTGLSGCMFTAAMRTTAPGPYRADLMDGMTDQHLQHNGTHVEDLNGTVHKGSTWAPEGYLHAITFPEGQLRLRGLHRRPRRGILAVGRLQGMKSGFWPGAGVWQTPRGLGCFDGLNSRRRWGRANGSGAVSSAHVIRS